MIWVTFVMFEAIQENKHEVSIPKEKRSVPKGHPKEK